jgi:hypothetical protein
VQRTLAQADHEGHGGFVAPLHSCIAGEKSASRNGLVFCDTQSVVGVFNIATISALFNDRSAAGVARHAEQLCGGSDAGM